MPNRSSRFIALIALLVGALIGCKSASGLEQPPPCPGDAVIRVGPKGQLDRPVVTLDSTKHEVAFWVSEDRTKNLFIEFQGDGPFEGMVQVQAPKSPRWRVQCKNWTCFSGDIKKEATGDYEYWQILVDKDGKEKKVDGHIIIKP